MPRRGLNKLSKPKHVALEAFTTGDHARRVNEVSVNLTGRSINCDRSRLHEDLVPR